MVALGIFFLLVGSISSWIIDDRVMLGSQAINMDSVGLIFLLLGALSVLLGIIWMAMATNTTHRSVSEHDVVVDKVPDEEPVVIKRRKPRKPKAG